jgi:hypothetical protein
MSLTFNTTIETVTYCGDSGYPETSGYGRVSDVVIEIEQGVGTVCIGKDKYTEGQLKFLLAQVKAMHKATKAFQNSAA